MSNAWLPYATGITAAGVAHAGVYGLNGAQWAVSPGNPATAAEAQAAVNHLINKSTSKINYGGIAYVSLVNDGEVCYGKFTGGCGITIAKSATAVIIGVYDKNCQPGTCNSAVQNMIKHLVDAGY